MNAKKHDITIGIVRNTRRVRRNGVVVRRVTGPVFAVVADPNTGREWKWDERDQPGLYDFLRDFIRRWRPLAHTGYKQRSGGRKGNEIVYGTLDEKRARWSAYQEFVDEKKMQNRSLKITDRRKLAAEHFGVHLKTITRHTK